MKAILFFRERAYLLFGILFLLSSIVYTLHIYQTKSVLWGDTRYYYAYTRSIILDQNINFDNEAFLKNVGFPNQPVFSTVTNRVINKFSPGAPILWIPGFVFGQLFTFIQTRISPQSFTNGYSWVTLWVVGLNSVMFSVFGLYLIFLALKEKFGRRVALLTCVILFLTTQVLFYTAIDPLNSHSASFLFSSLLFYLSLRWLFEKDRISFGKVCALGLVAGWLALIRNQDIIFCVPIGLAILFRSKFYITNFAKAVFFSLAALLPLLIQFNFTYYLYGQFNTPYTLGGEKFYWLKPDFIRVLFSQGNGFLFFAPIVLFFVWGLVKSAQKKNTVALSGLLIFALATYVIASWAPEILGGPYGSRMFTSTLPWLSYGGAVLLKENWEVKERRYLILLLIFVCSINTIAQTFYMLLTH